MSSRSVDASAKVGNPRPTPVRYPKGPESTLDTEIELRNVIEQQNLTPVTHVGTQNLTLARTTNLTLVPETLDKTTNLTILCYVCLNTAAHELTMLGKR